MLLNITEYTRWFLTKNYLAQNVIIVKVEKTFLNQCFCNCGLLASLLHSNYLSSSIFSYLTFPDPEKPRYISSCEQSG